MKVGMYNAGACGISQTFFVGTVNKNTDAAKGSNLHVKLPAGFRLIGFFIDIKAAFTSSLTLDITGDQKEPVKYVDAAKMDAVDFLEKDGKYAAIGDSDVTLTAKLSTAETGEGSADIYVKVVRLEV